jgi:hypothetical protein
MPRPRSGSELDALKAQQAALEKRIREVAARERARKATQDVRRNLLAGGIALDHMAAEPRSSFAATMLSLLNDAVRSAADRELFNLPPIPKSEGGIQDDNARQS